MISRYATNDIQLQRFQSRLKCEVLRNAAVKVAFVIVGVRESLSFRLKPKEASRGLVDKGI